MRRWGHGETEPIFSGGPGATVRMVFEPIEDHASQWAVITSIAEKLGCAAETLRGWVRQAKCDASRGPGLTLRPPR